MKTYLEIGQKRIKSANPYFNGQNEEKKVEPESNILVSEAYSIAVPNQKFVELVSKGTLPDWYKQIAIIAREDPNLASELSSLKSLRSIAEGKYHIFIKLILSTGKNFTLSCQNLILKQTCCFL